MTYCPFITNTLRIISASCIPPRLRSKTQSRAILLLPTWIYSCQSVGTVNFALHFTTSATISITILQTCRSWVATFLLRQPMAFLSHSSSDTPGLALLMNVLFWGRCDFPISFSGRNMSRNVWNRLYGSSMVCKGILQNNMRFPSPECYVTFWRTTIYSNTLHLWDITPMFYPLLIWTLLLNLTFYLFVWCFHRTFATGAACQQRRLLLLTPSPVPLWDLHVFLCCDQSLLNLSRFRTFEFGTSLGSSVLPYENIFHVSDPRS